MEVKIERVDYEKDPEPTGEDGKINFDAYKVSIIRTPSKLKF